METENTTNCVEAKLSGYTASDLSAMREYAWQYFLAHAQARLTTFRFYLVFCTIIGAGLFAIVSQGSHPQHGVPLAFLLTALSFIYWKVDVRHKMLIKHAEIALRWVESSSALPDIDGMPHPMSLFVREEFITAQLPRFPQSIGWRALWSYSTCVNVMFMLFGACGLVTCVLLLVLWH